MAGGGGEGASLEYTPTWVVALVCTVIVAISLAAERILHFAGKYLLNKNQPSLFQALQKIKEELMLMGFISLMLTVFQDRISKICIPKHWMNHWLPCNKQDAAAPKSTAHFEAFSFDLLPAATRHLLAAANSDTAGYCDAKGKTPLLSLKAVHDLHIFIFVLAASHVVFSALTIMFGGLRIQQWRHWEDSIQKKQTSHDPEEGMNGNKVTHVQDHAFIKSRFSSGGIGRLALFGWLKSILKQFYGSVKKSDYTTLRRGFIMSHCRGNPKFNFYKYMTRALENDFKKVVGISWYLWVFVVVFLLLNVYGKSTHHYILINTYILVVAVGGKLEHIMRQLAAEVASKHTAVTGELVVRPSDHHFWFHRPRIVLVMIHIVLFQNAFEFAVFLWMLWIFGFDSCIMGQVAFIIPRLVIGVFVQLLCSYSTLPLYAIVAQMGSSFNKAIFDDHIQVGLVGWAQKAKKNKGVKKVVESAGGGSSSTSNNQVAHQDSPLRSVEMSTTNQVENSEIIVHLPTPTQMIN
ncbi:MLO-like protein 1 [Sesamum alatum]|uniref:MLO-like protein n=1 Tax=Sesamum alatum TaxID=300844 RepID=A0AAE1YUC8_9LAMI|nr:MLO-like protein 1 [Sesamum alatum]